ncbi:ANR family transcriptional regulator [Vibrio owensii]|uniref:ANR family transcriptional regulator n=1 Tax=Vibrio owensii TaxID=696485 RepID=UPI003AAAC440
MTPRVPYGCTTKLWERTCRVCGDVICCDPQRRKCLNFTYLKSASIACELEKQHDWSEACEAWQRAFSLAKEGTPQAHWAHARFEFCLGRARSRRQCPVLKKQDRWHKRRFSG